MNFGTLYRAAANPSSGMNVNMDTESTSINSTDDILHPSSLSDLPTSILEAFIPGYRLTSRLIYQASGIDINLFVSVFVVAAALATSLRFAWDRFYTFFSAYCVASIHVDDEDDLYRAVLDWIAHRQVTQRARTLKVVTRTGADWLKDFGGGGSSSSSSGDDDSSNTVLSAFSDGDLGQIFNFTKLEAKVGPRYEPYYGSHHFWHGRRLFIFQRTRRDTGQLFRRMGPEEQILSLSTPGRSSAPLKGLMREIKSWYYERQKNLTVIRRPRPKEKGRSFYNAWVRVTVRPSRSLSTVALDNIQKSALVRDVNHFLHPATPRWYAERGIPYRRGYLFHGPPGTGKTSLVFALAGLFGLNIFCLSLLDPDLSESQLILLVNDLPYRSLVLLEDIDAAGLSRVGSDDDEDTAGKKDSTEKADSKAKEDEKGSEGSKEDAEKKDDANGRSSDTNATNNSNNKNSGKSSNDNNKNKSTISLSGLLNAIDGVAIQEGRILIMTTNHPDRLDEALVRPGRVDMQIKFDLATRAQAKEIFVRMFQGLGSAVSGDGGASDEKQVMMLMDQEQNQNDSKDRAMTKAKNKKRRRKAVANAPTPASAISANGKAKPNVNGKVKGRKRARKAREALPAEKRPGFASTEFNGGEDLEVLATRFAARIPDGKLSPAEIQGFLLVHAGQPRKALEVVKGWCAEKLKEKKAKGSGRGDESSAGKVVGKTTREGKAKEGDDKGSDGDSEDEDFDDDDGFLLSEEEEETEDEDSCDEGDEVEEEEEEDDDDEQQTKD